MVNIKLYEHYVTGILTSIKKPAVLISTIGVLESTNLQLAKVHKKHGEKWKRD